MVEELPARIYYDKPSTGKGADYRAIVYHAARDGNLHRLQVFLDNTDWKFRDHCLNVRDEGTDKLALVIAARNGKLDVVKYLLSKGADPERCGTVSFDGEIIHGAPPLWAAAAAGHLDIVKCLVEGAKVNINQVTHTNSSPLRGACYDGHLDVVRYLLDHGADLELANRHGHTPLMIAAFRKKVDIVRFLLERGACTTSASYKGNTALHDAAEANCLEVVELLLDAGAPLVDDDQGVCPLMGAAMLAHTAVFERLSRMSVPKLRLRDAWQMLGCTLVDRKMDLEGGVLAWKRAVNIELEPDDEAKVEARRGRAVAAIYTGVVEATTAEELQRMADDPDAIRMQALLIRERILGGEHNDVHYFLRLRGAVYCDMGDMERCFSLWKYALQLEQAHLDPLHISTLATLQSFYETFSLTLNDITFEGRGVAAQRDGLPISHDIVEYIFGQACYELERLHVWGSRPLHEDIVVEGTDYSVNDEKKRLAFTALQLILVDQRLTQAYSQLELKEKKGCGMDIKRLIRAADSVDVSLLHLACYETDRPEYTSMSRPFEDVHFPSPHCVERLLSAGIDVSRVDERGLTALHVILTNKKIRGSIVKLLLEGGSSLYIRDADGATGLELIQQKEKQFIKAFPLGRFFTLSGLAALAIVRLKIPYVDVVPRELVPFVQKH